MAEHYVLVFMWGILRDIFHLNLRSNAELLLLLVQLMKPRSYRLMPNWKGRSISTQPNSFLFLHQSEGLLFSLVVSRSHFFHWASSQSLEQSPFQIGQNVWKKVVFSPLKALSFLMRIFTTHCGNNTPVTQPVKGPGPLEMDLCRLSSF